MVSRFCGWSLKVLSNKTCGWTRVLGLLSLAKAMGLGVLSFIFGFFLLSFSFFVIGVSVREKVSKSPPSYMVEEP